MEEATLALVLALVGLVIGPWLGVVADRAVERSPLRPTQRCVGCSHELGRSSLVPVLSWRDRCSDCGRHKGTRYPVIDLATAAVFVVMGLRFGLGPALVPYLGLGAVLVVLSAIDFETHLLPNVIVWPTFVGGVVAVLVTSGADDTIGAVPSALYGVLVFGGFMIASHIAYPPGMGFGDVKLSLSLGLFLGWLQPGLVDTTRVILLAIIVALLGGAIVGLVANRLQRKGVKAEIPFGPALAAATVFMIVASPTLTRTTNL